MAVNRQKPTQWLRQPGHRQGPAPATSARVANAIGGLLALTVIAAGCADRASPQSSNQRTSTARAEPAEPRTRLTVPSTTLRKPAAASATKEPIEMETHGSSTSPASEAGRNAAPDRTDLPAPIDEERVASHGIRRLEGKHLTLYTDLPADTEIDRLPELFDQAYLQWCAYFNRDDLVDRAWHVRGCLMNDSTKFAEAGLLPDDLPAFKNGYARANELWCHEQPTAYYRRHLLLHEATHAFMYASFGTCGPPWYMEGTAELLATHSLVDGRLTLGVFPASPDDVPDWGRIRMVREAVAEGRLLTVDEILAYADDAHLQNEPYGWCWALATFLDVHPRYRDCFRNLPGELKAADFNARMREVFQDDWRELNEEWRVFVHELNFGYDLTRGAIEFAAGEPLDGEKMVTVRADRGWQSSGVRLEAGKTYRVTATGRYQVADQPRIWWCEPGGVTIRYVHGHPLGMLLAAVSPESSIDQATAGLLSPIPVGLEATITPEAGGTLYLRINESAAGLSDNAGTIEVRVGQENR